MLCVNRGTSGGETHGPSFQERTDDPLRRRGEAACGWPSANERKVFQSETAALKPRQSLRKQLTARRPIGRNWRNSNFVKAFSRPSPWLAHFGACSSKFSNAKNLGIMVIVVSVLTNLLWSKFLNPNLFDSGRNETSVQLASAVLSSGCRCA